MEAFAGELVATVLMRPELDGHRGLLRCVCTEWRIQIDVNGKDTKTARWVVVQTVPLLIWARELSCAWEDATCTLAAKGGHLEVLQYARRESCQWQALTCAAAAEGGHLECLQWLRDTGCGWDKWTCRSATLDCPTRRTSMIRPL
jgi:hypothetical protein